MLLKTGISFSCATCGHTLAFKSETASALVCPVCQSVNRRATLDIAELKKTDPVKEDMSIIRVGATGQYQGIAFEVIGRVQHFLSQGYRNHWYVITGKGEEMWLGEWAGNYSFFKETQAPSESALKKVRPGQKIQLANITFQVELVEQQQESYIEGEVPDYHTNEHGYIRVELLQPENFGMAVVNIFARNRAQLLVGQYQYFADLKLQHLRGHHDWI